MGEIDITKAASTEQFDIYKDISERTGGDIYIGVVGPVRTGKSTFITNLMERLVMPAINEGYEKERMNDELPQSANGKTIMTTQPKFVPSEAVTVQFGENLSVKVRLVDCVGYLIDGVNGHLDGENERMVKTPWDDAEIPFSKAAEIGTKRVITEHSTIGVVMTTDGSIATDLPRKAYIDAEARVVNELKALNKPFVIVLNSKVPESAETIKLAKQMSEKYKACVIPLNVLSMTAADIENVFKSVLFEFPLRGIDLKMGKWMQALEIDNPIIGELLNMLTVNSEGMKKMSDYTKLSELPPSTYFDKLAFSSIDLGKGRIVYEAIPKPDLFYKALSEECGETIDDDFVLMGKIKDLVAAKQAYDKIGTALDEARNFGYGVVRPSLDEMTLEEPQIIKQGARFGVKLKATAPSLHIMRVDIESEVNPIVGSEQQSEDLAKSLLSRFENDPKGIWHTDIFGRSLHGLVNDGLNSKLLAMPQETQKKMRKTLSRIVNEGKGGVICILL